MKPEGIKLNDEQVRRFICDGVVVLDSGVAPEVHQQIYDKIQWNNTREFNMGNNVLPRIAELQQILDAPAIHGALRAFSATTTCCIRIDTCTPTNRSTRRSEICL